MHNKKYYFLCKVKTTTYFGKSQSWLMQRINGNKVNGKEAHFSADEAKQLEAALHDIGNKLLSIAF